MMVASYAIRFQSLTWVERLSDPQPEPERRRSPCSFQSLTWVERLSDQEDLGLLVAEELFQSLTWVERLSDRRPGQASAGHAEFQSLTWVERLSDRSRGWASPRLSKSFNPSPGLNVFQTLASFLAGTKPGSFNPSPGLNVFQTDAPVGQFSRASAVSIPHLG